METEQTPTGWWHNFPKYMVSLLKAWYGDHAAKSNGYGYEWLPKIVGDHSQLPMTLAMRDGRDSGDVLPGPEPRHRRQQFQTGPGRYGQLDWMVVRDCAETETACFWTEGHLVRDGEMKPEDIGTEVFLMPGSMAGEKDGTFTNTHRLLQWHDKVVEGRETTGPSFGSSITSASG